ncbi:MAG: RsmB/NOP family class I SAM-dependent RNA methyltransferase [Halocynthiibacter sp.]
MTPAARISAAIEILDAFLADVPAEKALTTWARRSRFAGSKDRAAIRDHVFDAVRNLNRFAALGGAHTGRGIMIGALKSQNIDPTTLFTGEGHAPPPLEEGENTESKSTEAIDLPTWLVPVFKDSLGAEFDDVLDALGKRAPVFLRVNTRKTTLTAAQESLSSDGVKTRPCQEVGTSLEVLENPRRVAQSEAYQSGLVELQDQHSQALCRDVELWNGARVLDYCAGGGGKSLALGARADIDLVAHDRDFKRMSDLTLRAERAGMPVRVVDGQALGNEASFDVVICDVPCSGSGAWRRAPEGKWRLTPERFLEIQGWQRDILKAARHYVKPGGMLYYMTCSLLQAENQAQIDDAIAKFPDLSVVNMRNYPLSEAGDGFFIAALKMADELPVI